VLIDWGALDEKAPVASTAESARDALLSPANWGSVINLVRSAQRTASSMRERLSPDFWALLLDLEGALANRTDTITSEAQALRLVETTLRVVSALSGLTLWVEAGALRWPDCFFISLSHLAGPYSTS